MIKQQQLYCYYFQAEDTDFDRALAGLMSGYSPAQRPVRLVFYGAPADNREYRRQWSEIAACVRNRFGDQAPVFSYVAQPPLGGCSLLLEAHEERFGSLAEVCYKRIDGIPYITVVDDSTRMLYIGGVMADDPNAPVWDQSMAIFDRIGSILNAEAMPVDSIVRQWNYIERITGFEGERQRYQDFNDARTFFYQAAQWADGYPSATGIGALAGGIVVELQAVTGLPGERSVFPVDNRLQVAAHNYSPEVLIGEEAVVCGGKTTPKFERAKLVVKNAAGQLFISGTAAIRGELSVESMDVTEQMNVTLDNIEYLVSAGALTAAGFAAQRNCGLLCFRVYIKYPEQYEAARRALLLRYPELPVVYVEADICRDELLIEIEGVAEY